MDTDFTAVPDWFSFENAGAGIAVADLTGDGRPDLVVLMVDDPPGQNAGYFRIGVGAGNAGEVGAWTPWIAVPDWNPWLNQGAGIAVADVSGTGQPDLIVFMVDAVPDGANAGYYRIGWDLQPTGQVSGWSRWMAVPDWFPWVNAGADIAVADVDGDGRLDLVILMVDAPAGRNQGYYRSGPLSPDGTVAAWRGWVAVPDWYFWENQGAGIAVADLDDDGTPELLVLAVDSPPGQNGGYYCAGWRLEAGRPADGWGPWQPIPTWRFWEGQDAALAVAGLGAAGMPHLVVLTVDNPPGANDGWYRVLDVMTDLEMAPQMGVWRLLENDAQVNPVHAALLPTGSVLFFAGSGNDPDRHGGRQYPTAVWHYPRPAYSNSLSPADLFCCGHAFLPDGRLLASGGTEQYDPFFGLRQAVTFDPHAGTPDPASPTGTTGAWTVEPDMSGGRWYPTLVALPDGRVLAVSGLDGDSQLNVFPDVYTGGAGWTQLPQSPSNWPMYGHLFLLADGRLYYSGGQYGGSNGVRPSIWDLTTNTATDVKGILVDAGRRNQSASVLLPPAQDQRVLLMGGGPADMHDQTGATATTAITDLSAPGPIVTTAAPMAMRRMHLCATLLPDRTVLINGGSMMEESAADATLEAELYRPDAGGGPGTWVMAATSRVPRLYHSVALLMPDGKVITTGSNPARKTEELRIEVFWPPYLFAGRRPVCMPADAELHYGESAVVTVPDPGEIASAALMRPGATTHSMDGEQRLVDLPYQITGPDQITLQLPGSPGLAPPGWYMVFVVNTSGVPSEAAWIHLT
ncbi:MAG TPA: galactose oxidase-like domain-containing protein [Actinoplanes sp.]|jgi:hypothetical protein|nr:galactose oxidase-like domain-containing protein [Actinoplanes sp.]